jgi:Holliday junction resolvase-like predicted endonuclease
MTTINPYYGTYLPPTPPPEEPPLPPPPVVIGADGRPREPEVIIVIGQRTDPYRHLMPYRGLTGGAENSRRDMEMAMAGPEVRALMLGMNPYASDDLGRDGDGVVVDDTGIIDAATLLEPAAEVIDVLRQEVEEQFSKSIDNKILGEIGERAAEMHLDAKGLTLVEKQVRVIVKNEDGRLLVRIYDFLVRDASGALSFIEVKANGGTRNQRQRDADSAMEATGGILATSKPSLAFMPRTLPPTPVDVWNIIVPPRGT